MALTLLKQEVRKIGGGQNGALQVTGTFTWTSTNTTGTLPFAVGQITGAITFTPLATVTGPETHAIDNTSSIVNTTTGYVAVPATGLPILRVASSPTSGLTVSYSYVGY
jgi:hypothetical protein